MIEPIMFFGVGFLVAALIGLVFIPLVHARAVRLTVRRIEAATPLSMAEIQADKDQLRAEFAMSTRRLEMSVEQLKAKTTSQFAELAKKSEAITKLKTELGEKSAAILGMEARERATKDQIRATEEEFNQRLAALQEAERKLADKEAELATLAAALDERAVDADSQRIEMVALNTQIEALKTRLSDSEHDLKDTERRLALGRSDVEAAARELMAERAKVASLDERIVELEKQLAAQGTEAELLGKRSQELEVRLTEQGRLLAQREHQHEQLKAQLANMQKVEASLRAELAALTGRQDSAVQTLRSEKALLEEQLNKADDERTRLQRDLATMKRDTETSWAADRVENAQLRERINDIAAEIAHLTATLEGPNSPIDQMLAEHAVQSKRAANGNPAAVGEPAPSLIPAARNGGPGSLADRIRALQDRAARLQAST
jgi:chromosome segregation ATPase